MITNTYDPALRRIEELYNKFSSHIEKSNDIFRADRPRYEKCLEEAILDGKVILKSFDKIIEASLKNMRGNELSFKDIFEAPSEYLKPLEEFDKKRKEIEEKFLKPIERKKIEFKDMRIYETKKPMEIINEFKEFLFELTGLHEEDL